METHSARAHTSPRAGTAIVWTEQHQGTTTVVAIVAAVLAGVLLGIMLSMASSAESSTPHRAGGHALATVAQAQHAAAAAVTAVAGGETATATATDSASTRSPARGGFAVGRTAGAGSGFIVVAAGTRAPVRGGFAGRSLGAGHVPADDPQRAIAAGS